MVWGETDLEELIVMMIIIKIIINVKRNSLKSPLLICNLT